MNEPQFKKMFGIRNATCFFNINICRIKIFEKKGDPYLYSRLIHGLTKCTGIFLLYLDLEGGGRNIRHARSSPATQYF